jgi:Tetratricopeptide repeat
MSLGEILSAILVGLAVNECCRFSEWAARRLIGWAARLSYGGTPRAQVRIAEQTGDLDNCRAQLAKLCFALRFTVEGILTWTRRVIGRPVTLASERPDPTYLCSAAVEAISRVLTLQGFDDIRALPRARRKEFGVLTARLHELLRHPAEAFDQDSAARLLTVAATACEAYIDDRNERAAERLAQAAGSLAGRLSRDHPAALGVHRAYAHALLQLGHHERAEALLRELNADETRRFGPDDPRTFRTRRLLSWALVGTGRFAEAEAGLRALDAGMAQLSGADSGAGVPLWLHVRCMLSWTISCQGRPHEAAVGYDAVVADRSRELGPDHPDTLDARHSKGKLFVQHGDGPRARAVLRLLLADRTRVQGRHHPDTLETQKYLALACACSHPHGARAGRETLRELRRILRIQTKKHGPDHPNTHDTRQWLATLTGSTKRR